MSKPSSTEIVFIVEDDPEGGFIASALDHSMVTRAESLDALKPAVRDAVACHFEETERPKIIRLHYICDDDGRVAQFAKHDHGFILSISTRAQLQLLDLNDVPAPQALESDAKERPAVELDIPALVQESAVARGNTPSIMNRLRCTDHSTVQPKENDSLRLAAVRRSIRDLFHFTRLAALPSIAKHGLLSRLACDERGIQYSPSDVLRLDGLADYISLSISWPNWQLFYRYRQDEQTADEAWCILVLRPNIIWTLECLFTAINAASTSESRLSIEARKGAAGFERLFDDSGSMPLGVTRAQLCIADNMPTCHQAEVLVRRHVPWDCVTKIIVCSDRAKQLAQSTLPHYALPMLKISREPFEQRRDWRMWVNRRDTHPRYPSSDAMFRGESFLTDDSPF